MRYTNVVITCLIAMMLSLLPLPDWAKWFRPEWLGMVVIYWVLQGPDRFNVGLAWCVGLCQDSLLGNVLGVHALAFAMLASVVDKLHRQLRLFPVGQQMLLLFVLIFMNQLILASLQQLLGGRPNWPVFWLPATTSMLLWPWIYTVLRDFQRRFAS